MLIDEKNQRVRQAMHQIFDRVPPGTFLSTYILMWKLKGYLEDLILAPPFSFTSEAADRRSYNLLYDFLESSFGTREFGVKRGRSGGVCRID